MKADVLGGTESGGSSGKDSLAYIQLEKHNERLKEALIRFVVQFLLLIVTDGCAQFARHVSRDRTGPT